MLGYPALLLALVLGAAHSLPRDPGDEQCGYKNCPEAEADVLNVHIVAHTHDDVGWLKTVDQYYYGSEYRHPRLVALFNSTTTGVSIDIRACVASFNSTTTGVSIDIRACVASFNSTTTGVSIDIRACVASFNSTTTGVSIDIRACVASFNSTTTGNCPEAEADVLNVHIVAHTHDDVGWLKTVDQYYYGSRNNIQKAGVQYILDSVVKELLEDPKRKFIYVETAFFWKWWVLQGPKKQEQVRALVDEGRLVFVGGAWSMNDEAAAHYQSVVDQLTWGLSKLNETFGPCALPRAGWQIDPFGHSREFASILAAAGFDGLFLGRIDFQDKRERLKSGSMEMLWRGDDDLGASSDIFTSVLYNTYSPPPGFCFDVLCDDEPFVDDITSPMYNVDHKVALFVDYVTDAARQYRSNNFLVTMGGDFTYQDANMWYTNLDKLIEYTNLKAAKERLNIKLFYSTPNCYLKAVKKADPVLPIKQDDFFPYASDAHSYWTGYFTSRPATKHFEREANNYLQVAKQLQVLAGLKEDNQIFINSLKSAMGVMQHHDAVTGTEKQHVARDYVRMLDGAVEDALVVPREAFTKVLQNDSSAEPLFSYTRCALNESSCHVSESSANFVVSTYNSLAWERWEPLRVAVVAGDYEVYAPNGDKIDSQLVEIHKRVRAIPNRRSNATHELVFMAHLKPLKYKSYFVQKLTRTKRDVTFIQPKTKDRAMDASANVNDYWKDIRENTYVVIKNIESDTERGVSNRPDINRVPEEPVESAQTIAQAIDLDVLKDKDQSVSHAAEIDRLIKEAGEKIATMMRERETVNVYPRLNEDEMRMLSDGPREPRIVERFDDVLADQRRDSDEILMDDGRAQLRFDKRSGAVQYSDREGGVGFQMDLRYYPAVVGNNEEAANRSSGAYIFRPQPNKLIALQTINHTVQDGPILKEFLFEKVGAVFTIRMYKPTTPPQNDFIEVDWLVGPINVNDDIGKEYILQFNTTIATKEFYTDSNGRQRLKRILNKRPQWNVSLAEPVSGNYYPVTNSLTVEDDQVSITVLTDRAQGGSSLRDGGMELMLHRRLLHDDAFGVGEALNETENGEGLIVRGTQRVAIKMPKEDIAMNAIEMQMRPLVFVSDAGDMKVEDWLKMKNCFSWSKEPLPKGVHLLTLEPWGERLLLRLENLNNSTVEVDVANMLVDVNIKSLKELKLSANEGHKKWDWKTEEGFARNFNEEYGSFEEKRNAEEVESVSDDGFKVKIRAKEIRTFISEYEKE